MSLKKINGYTIFLNQEIGRGNFGTVYVCQQDGTRVKCAAKMLDKMKIDSDQYFKSAIFRQIQILKNLRNQHIVGFFDVMQSQRYYYIIQQLCTNDLDRLLKREVSLAQDKAINYLIQICDGFLTLVQEGIVHRDLKPANIMLRKDSIKIGDFGLAKRNCNKRLKIQSTVGTPLYMSLQLLKSQPYSSKCDIWAIGCIFYQMLHGEPPWIAKTEYALAHKIQNQEFKLKEQLSQQTSDFIKMCLQKKQTDRISWDELFLHKIFKGYFEKYLHKKTKFQNKLKMLMSDLRFKINSQNIDLRKLIQKLGLNNNNKQLNFKHFEQFFKLINPCISQEQVIFFFEKMDKNDDGKISIHELQNQMQANYIPINKDQDIKILTVAQIKNKQALLQVEQGQLVYFQNSTKLHNDLQFKIKKCFVKLFKILNQRKLTLYKTFRAYNQKKNGRLNIEQFENILIKLDDSLTKKQLKEVFQFIDSDKSGTIQFDELNNYYCKENGVPEIIDLLPEHYYIKCKIGFLNQLSYGTQLSQFFKINV